MGLKASFLVVDGDRELTARVIRPLVRFGAAYAVVSVADAVRRISASHYSGLVIAAGLPDGSGMEFVRRLRSLEAMRRIATGLPEATRAVLLLAETLADHRDLEPLEGAVVVRRRAVKRRTFERFARTAIAAEHLRSPACEHIAAVADEHKLSGMETRVLALEAAAVPRDEWTSILRVTRATLRTFVHRALRKADSPSLKDLAAPAVRAVMARDELLP